MGTKLISLTQLNNEHLSDSRMAVFRKVVARDDLGDVDVWHCQQGAWTKEPGVDDQDAAAGEFTNLIVLGEPKVVATKMVTGLAFGRGVFEAPISMTLAHGLNWAQRRYTRESTEKAEMLDHLNGMRKKSFQRLEYDRFHFSSLVINDLLSGIDQSIKRRDWLNFVAAVEQLCRQDALRIDPNGTTSDWWVPRYE
ncbi:MAG: hypothetical protein ACI9UN_005102 [Granulosicoccus sp.]|jgi:hypothetical protein